MHQRRNYFVGDTLPPVEAKALITPGPPRWHCLIVYPQREAPTRIWLGEHGIDSFYPVTISRQRYRGRDISRVRRYLPGYVFANFGGDPIWWRIMGDDRQNVRDVLRLHDGTPGWLHEDTLTQLQAMREVDKELEERKRQARTIRKGDRVRIKTGPFKDFTDVEVKEIKGLRGMFEVMIFGRPTPVEVGLEQVEKLG